MFDHHGNPLEIPQMPFAERMSVEGFEFVENFTKVKNANGTEDAIPTGYTKKFKTADRLKFAKAYGREMGYLRDEQPEAEDDALKSLTVVFVDSTGKRVDVDLNPPERKPRVIEHQPKAENNDFGVKFVR